VDLLFRKRAQWKGSCDPFLPRRTRGGKLKYAGKVLGPMTIGGRKTHQLDVLWISFSVEVGREREVTPIKGGCVKNRDRGEIEGRPTRPSGGRERSS